MIEFFKKIFHLGDYAFYRTLGAARSNQWPAIRAAHLRINPNCSVCGTRGSFLKPNEVHHCAVFHLNPQLELEESNLITLCRNHHLLVGHLMDWKSFNENVREDAGTWLEKVKNRPEELSTPAP
jgi:5-methylcytosine-specific restriction endonuclease McrA